MVMYLDYMSSALEIRRRLSVAFPGLRHGPGWRNSRARRVPEPPNESMGPDIRLSTAHELERAAGEELRNAVLYRHFMRGYMQPLADEVRRQTREKDHMQKEVVRGIVGHRRPTRRLVPISSRGPEFNANDQEKLDRAIYGNSYELNGIRIDPRYVAFDTTRKVTRTRPSLG